MPSEQPSFTGIYYADKYYEYTEFSEEIIEHYRCHFPRIIAQLPKTPERILDYGCGYGYLTSVIHEFFPKSDLNAFDIAITPLKRGAQNTPNAKFLCSDGLYLPYDDQTFDIVFIFEVLEHIDDQHLAALEAYRVTKIGGFIVLLQEFRLEDYAHLQKQIGRLLRRFRIIKQPAKSPYSPKELHISAHKPLGWAQFLSQLNLKIKHIQTLSVLPPIYYIFPKLRSKFYNLPILTPIDRRLCKIPFFADNFALSNIFISQKI